MPPAWKDIMPPRSAAQARRPPGRRLGGASWGPRFPAPRSRPQMMAGPGAGAVGWIGHVGPRGPGTTPPRTGRAAPGGMPCHAPPPWRHARESADPCRSRSRGHDGLPGPLQDVPPPGPPRGAVSKWDARQDPGPCRGACRHCGCRGAMAAEGPRWLLIIVHHVMNQFPCASAPPRRRAGFQSLCRTRHGIRAARGSCRVAGSGSHGVVSSGTPYQCRVPPAS